MRVITKDNFCRDLFTEQVVAENVNEVIGAELVKTWNEKHWNERSDFYLALVDDNYELHDGYADLV